MNMGVGDAVDWAGELAARLQGWGGDALLDSYEAERRPVHKTVIEEALANHAILGANLWRDELEDATAAGDAARKELGEHISATKVREFHTLGTVLGVGYEGSPIVAAEDGPAPERDGGSIGRPRVPATWRRTRGSRTAVALRRVRLGLRAGRRRGADGGADRARVAGGASSARRSRSSAPAVPRRPVPGGAHASDPSHVPARRRWQTPAARWRGSQERAERDRCTSRAGAGGAARRPHPRRRPGQPAGRRGQLREPEETGRARLAAVVPDRPGHGGVQTRAGRRRRARRRAGRRALEDARTWWDTRSARGALAAVRRPAVRSLAVIEPAMQAIATSDPRVRRFVLRLVMARLFSLSAASRAKRACSSASPPR